MIPHHKKKKNMKLKVTIPLALLCVALLLFIVWTDSLYE